MEKNNKLLLWGGDFFLKESLQNHFNQEVFWVSAHEDADLNIRILFSGNFKKAENGLIPSLSTIIKLKSNFFDYFVRAQSRHTYNDHLFWGRYHDITHLFYRLIYFFYDFFSKKKFRVLIFCNYPHEGADVVAWHLGEYFNCTRLVLMQSIIQERYFILKNTLSFKNYLSGALLSDTPPPILGKKHEKQLVYMRNIEKKEFITSKKNFILKYIRSALKLKIKNLVQNYMNYNWQKNNRLFSVSAIGDKRYVYFPLHLQPELTVDVLGEDLFFDQLTAIEVLSAILPDSWYLVIKENPKQTWKTRGDNFYKRLTEIRNCILARREVDTYTLIENCEFVATITGTAGWEAITGGKPAVIFGNVWYEDFPGVFLWSENISVKEITNYKIDHNCLVETYIDLCNRMGVGFIDTEYVQNINLFNADENAYKISETIMGLIGDSQ